MDRIEAQQAHVRFTEPSSDQERMPVEDAESADPVHESSAGQGHETGWLSKPIVQDLLEHEMAIAIQTVFTPHLSSIESEVSSTEPQEHSLLQES